MSGFRIGVYVRESRDDNEENYETIETQRDLLIDYIKKNNLGEVIKIYVDDNASGSAFEREGIYRLKEDVMYGRINLLVLKDLSRLGRNNAKTLMFLDFLEEYGVRVITFDGRYDSVKDNDTVGIDTWFNERYIRDISRKIRANLRFKIEKGEYIGSAPYGYIKSDDEKNRLAIDENTAPVVREIFSLYKQGYGYGYIAKHLSSKGYPPPSEKHNGASLSKLWNAVAVQRILCNRTYAGDTVQGVSEKISFKSKKTRRLPQNRWVITTNTHPPIILREEFDEVQKLRSGKRKNAGPHKGKLHLLRGLLYCGKCGNTMIARVRKDRPMGYICGNYGRNGRGGCSSHYVSEKVIRDVLLCEIGKLIDDEAVREKAAELIDKNLVCKGNYQAEITKLEQQLANKQKQQDILYFDKLEGKVSEQLFERMNANIENKISSLLQDINIIKSKENKEMDGESILGSLKANLNKIGLTNKMIHMMVDRIFLFEADDTPIESYNLNLNNDQAAKVSSRGAIVINFRYAWLNC